MKKLKSQSIFKNQRLKIQSNFRIFKLLHFCQINLSYSILAFTYRDDSKNENIRTFNIKWNSITLEDFWSIIGNSNKFELDIQNTSNDWNIYNMACIKINKSRAFTVICKATGNRTTISFSNMCIYAHHNLGLCLHTAEKISKVKDIGSAIPDENLIRLDVNTEYEIEFDKSDVTDAHFILTSLFSEELTKEESEEPSSVLSLPSVANFQLQLNIIVSYYCSYYKLENFI